MLSHIPMRCKHKQHFYSKKKKNPFSPQEKLVCFPYTEIKVLLKTNFEFFT